MTDTPGEPALCPSARCEPGAILLGMVGRGGEVQYISPAMEVGERFVEQARERGRPERRFRFAQPCACEGCGYWTGESRCGVVDAVVEHCDPLTTPLPKCSIRARCRWYAQRGAEACGICPLVVRDLD